MGIEIDIERLQEKKKRLESIFQYGFRTREGVPLSLAVDRDSLKRELDNVNKNLNRLTPKKYEGNEEQKEREWLDKTSKVLQDNLLPKDRLMGEKVGRTKSEDGVNAHDIREAREQDVIDYLNRDERLKKVKQEYDKRRNRFNFNKGENALPSSEELRRGQGQ